MGGMVACFAQAVWQAQDFALVPFWIFQRGVVEAA